MRVVIKLTGLQLTHAVIQGTFSDSKLVQFSVSIVYCMNQSIRSTCYSFCSGSLIAPDVVLTAGHCVYDEKKSTFKEFVPPRPISQMSVVVGSRNPRLGDDGVLVSVKSVINAGFSRSSLLFPFDDDVGLIFLSECVQMVPGSITTAKVATLQSEPTGPNTIVTIQGHGINANIPDQIRTDDLSSRYMKSAIQTYDVCIDAAVYIALQSQGIDPSILDDPLYSKMRNNYFSQFVPEKTICAGGNTWPYSACDGDSGGGWIHSSNGVDQIIGIVSFRIGSSTSDDYCSYSPDYATRVAFYADWIKEQIVANSLNCPGWDISQTFASTNVEPLPSSEYSQVMQNTRCTPFTQFQCYSGTCVDWEQVCDSVANCGPFDNSDEDSAMCAGSGPVLYENIPFQHVQQPRLFDHIQIPAGIPRFDPFAELVIPVVRSVDPAIGLLTCNNLVEYMQARISAERREGLNRAEYDTSVWTELCNKFGQCALEDVYLGTFCDDWNGFLVRRNLAQSISLGFNARFGSSADAPDFPHQPPLPAFDFNSSDVIGTTVSPSDVPITSIGGPVPFDPITSSTSQRGLDPRNPFVNMFTAGVVIMAFHI